MIVTIPNQGAERVTPFTRLKFDNPTNDYDMGEKPMSFDQLPEDCRGVVHHCDKCRHPVDCPGTESGKHCSNCSSYVRREVTVTRRPDAPAPIKAVPLAATSESGPKPAQQEIPAPGSTTPSHSSPPAASSVGSNPPPRHTPPPVVHNDNNTLTVNQYVAWGLGIFLGAILLALVLALFGIRPFDHDDEHPVVQAATPVLGYDIEVTETCSTKITVNGGENGVAVDIGFNNVEAITGFAEDNDGHLFRGAAIVGERETETYVFDHVGGLAYDIAVEGNGATINAPDVLVDALPGVKQHDCDYVGFSLQSRPLIEDEEGVLKVVADPATDIQLVFYDGDVQEAEFQLNGFENIAHIACTLPIIEVDGFAHPRGEVFTDGFSKSFCDNLVSTHDDEEAQEFMSSNLSEEEFEAQREQDGDDEDGYGFLDNDHPHENSPENGDDLSELQPFGSITPSNQGGDVTEVHGNFEITTYNVFGFDSFVQTSSNNSNDWSDGYDEGWSEGYMYGYEDGMYAADEEMLEEQNFVTGKGPTPHGVEVLECSYDGEAVYDCLEFDCFDIDGLGYDCSEQDYADQRCFLGFHELSCNSPECIEVQDQVDLPCISANPSEFFSSHSADDIWWDNPTPLQCVQGEIGITSWPVGHDLEVEGNFFGTVNHVHTWFNDSPYFQTDAPDFIANLGEQEIGSHHEVFMMAQLSDEQSDDPRACWLEVTVLGIAETADK